MRHFVKKMRAIALAMCFIVVAGMSFNAFVSYAEGTQSVSGGNANDGSGSDGESAGGAESVNVIFSVGNGNTTYVVGGQQQGPYSSWMDIYTVGETVGTKIDALSDPVFNDSTGTFKGWLPGLMTEGTIVPLEGAELLSSAAVLAYEIPAGYTELYFAAQWDVVEPEIQDVTAPVFEDLSITYIPDTNMLSFQLKAYDAESEHWRINLQIKDAAGRSIGITERNITENPHVFEYSAERMANGTYELESVNLWDDLNNVYHHYYDEGEFTFEVTNSPFENEIVIKDITASKDKVTVSKEKSETVTVTVDFEKGLSALVKDPDNNNRVGYLSYNYSDYIDLYLDEQGNVTGTYDVDWMVRSGDEYVYRVYINYQDGDKIRYQTIEYDYSEMMGSFAVENPVVMDGDLNYGPFRVKEFSVTDKATGQALENGKFFDVSDGKTYELDFRLVIEEELPANIRLMGYMQPSLNNGNGKYVYFEKQLDGSYFGTMVVDEAFNYTEYSYDAIVAMRGVFGHHYTLTYSLQPYFNVKYGSQYAVDSHDLEVKVYSFDTSSKLIYTNTVKIEGRSKLTVEDLLGGAENYAALAKQMVRADGSDNADVWQYGSGINAETWRKDEVVDIYSGQTSITVYPHYTYFTVTPRVWYVDEQKNYVSKELEPVRVERGASMLDVYNQLEAAGKIPSVPDLGDYTFVQWNSANWSDNFVRYNSNLSINAVYNMPFYPCNTRVLNQAGESGWVVKAFFGTENTTVADLLAQMPQPEEVPGYTFLRWEIDPESQCYLGNEQKDGVWVSVYGEFKPEMKLSEYGAPRLLAVYEENAAEEEGDNDYVEEEDEPTATPQPTVAPTVAPQPTATPNPTVAPTATPEPAATKTPAIVTPPGEKLSEQKVTQAVEQIANVIAAVKENASTTEVPKVTFEMKSDNGKVATVVPVEILEAVKGQNVDVVLDMGGYSWTINGADIKASELAEINLEVKADTNAVPSKLVETLADGAPTTQLSLTHEGNFGFKASLSINVGAENVGQFGNMYYYDSNNRLVFMNAGKIDEQGNVNLSFSHASDYVVVVGEEVVEKEGTVFVEADGTLAMADTKEPATSDKKEPEATEKPAEDSKKEPATVTPEPAVDDADGGNNVLVVVAIVVVIAVAAIALIVVLNKKKEKK